MQSDFWGSLSLVDGSGQFIMATILALLTSSVGSTWIIRRRYAELERQIQEHTDPSAPFESRFLQSIVRDAREALRRSATEEVNVQPIVEHRLQSELKSLLVGERYVKASTSLAIILGLVGTFYGLTSAIGKLVGLVAGDSPGAVDITQAITKGLTQALSGMSVAFSCSLVGIVSAILMTLVGVFFNVADRRTRLMAQVEAYVDGVLQVDAREDSEGRDGGGASAGGRGLVRASGGQAEQRLALTVDDFAQAVAQLQGSIANFDAALQRFSVNTREFQEFNLHLKDNIQRMSLTFGDLSDTIKGQVGVLKSRVQG